MNITESANAIRSTADHPPPIKVNRCNHECQAQDLSWAKWDHVRQRWPQTLKPCGRCEKHAQHMRIPTATYHYDYYQIHYWNDLRQYLIGGVCTGSTCKMDWTVRVTWRRQVARATCHQTRAMLADRQVFGCVYVLKPFFGDNSRKSTKLNV
jgi:hypothetical protein